MRYYRSIVPLLIILMLAVTVAPGCKKSREKKANYTITTTGAKDTTLTGKAHLFFTQSNFFGVKVQTLSVELEGDGADYITIDFYSSNDEEVLLERKFTVNGSSNYWVEVTAYIDGVEYYVDSGLPGYVELTKASKTRVDGTIMLNMYGNAALEMSGNFEAYDY